MLDKDHMLSLKHLSCCTSCSVTLAAKRRCAVRIRAPLLLTAMPCSHGPLPCVRTQDRPIILPVSGSTSICSTAEELSECTHNA